METHSPISLTIVAACVFFATLASAQTSTPSGPLVIKRKDGQVIQGLHITSKTGDCVQIIDSSDITIQNSDIGPCAGNAVKVIGGNGVNIFDSYIHPETLASRCCDSNDGIFALGASHLLIQGNVIAYGESNIEVLDGNTVTVRGNLLLNPRGPFPRGDNFQCWRSSPTSPGCTNVTVENNYALSSLDRRKYLYPEAVEDSINFGHTDGIVAQNNYITGGHSISGCALNADQAANDAQFLNNIVVDTGQCGIAVHGGTNDLIERNKITIRNPVVGGGNQAIVVSQVHSNGACGQVTVSNNISVFHRLNGTFNGFYKGRGCDPLTLVNNVFGRAALSLLTPMERELPPPSIPPQPKNCVVLSPYSTQTGWPACVR
jgi:parallel beta helix pectate lyase-like protein